MLLLELLLLVVVPLEREAGRRLTSLLLELLVEAGIWNEPVHECSVAMLNVGNPQRSELRKVLSSMGCLLLYMNI